MKKLRLQADELEVQSFATGGDDVPARELFATRPEVCDPFSMPPRCS